jgi:hypothetical protein
MQLFHWHQTMLTCRSHLQTNFAKHTYYAEGNVSLQETTTATLLAAVFNTLPLGAATAMLMVALNTQLPTRRCHRAKEMKDISHSVATCHY